MHEQFAVVRAQTLKDALRKAKAKYGPDVCIVESRTVHQRAADSLGQERRVEVLVDPRGEPQLSHARPARTQAAEVLTRGLTDTIATEVARIEKLVEHLVRQRRRQSVPEELGDYPLAAVLCTAGASHSAVRQLADSFHSSAVHGEQNLASALAHLRSHLRTVDGSWTSISGCHLFLGDSGAGKTDLVLSVAARLRAMDREPLVLSVLPQHGGEIRRLQLQAAEHSYDAALIQQGEQLVRLLKEPPAYDAVLIDTPGILSRTLVESGELQEFLSQNEMFHRHFVLPLDLDFQDAADLWELARFWNCDWLALSRMDRSRRLAKILDFLTRLPLPLSFTTSGSWPESEPQIARADTLVDLMVKSGGGGQTAQAQA